MTCHSHEAAQGYLTHSGYCNERTRHRRGEVLLPFSVYRTGINMGGFKSLSTSNIVRRYFTCMFYFLKLGDVGATGEGYSPDAGQTVRCQVIRRATTMRRVQRARFDHESAIFVYSSHSHHGGCTCGTNCHPRPWYFYGYHFRLYFSVLGYPFRAAPVSLRNDGYMYC